MKNLTRILALVLRYFTMLRRSLPRLLETIYWPLLNLLLMGFLNRFLAAQTGSTPLGLHWLLAASVLNEYFTRASIGFMLSFIEEVYSRNLPQLYGSPLRLWEQVCAYLTISLARVALGMAPALVACWLLFDYNPFELGGWSAVLIASQLLTGMAFGLLMVSIILRFGQSAEWFGWMLSFLITPFIGIYYPVSILPGWMRVVGQALPPAPLFALLRQLMAGAPADMSLLWQALALNALYLCVGAGIFWLTFRDARRRGTLLSLSE